MQIKWNLAGNTSVWCVGSLQIIMWIVFQKTFMLFKFIIWGWRKSLQKKREEGLWRATKDQILAETMTEMPLWRWTKSCLSQKKISYRTFNGLDNGMCFVLVWYNRLHGKIFYIYKKHTKILYPFKGYKLRNTVESGWVLIFLQGSKLEFMDSTHNFIIAVINSYMVNWHCGHL